MAGDDIVKLYLHGTVGGWYGGFDYASVRRALAGVSGGTIEVHLNSYGGDMFEGIAIKNHLRQREEKVVVYIDGVAASSASVIAMAGDEIIMPADTQLMIHNPWTYAAGNAKDLRKIADDLDKSEISIRASYLHRFKGDEAELIALLDEESWLTAEEAVTLGLADKVLTSAPENDVEEELEEAVSAKVALMAKYGSGIAKAVEEIEANNIVTGAVNAVQIKTSTMSSNFKANLQKLFGVSES